MTDSRNPKLFDMLDDGPVTLLLGAGSSKEYGFPDWGELKERIKISVGEDLSNLGISRDIAVEIEQALSMGTENTLDKIASEIFNPECRASLQKLIARELLIDEAKSMSLSEPKWIELFCEALKDYLKRSDRQAQTEKSYDQRLKKLQTLSVVSLNYDRLFIQRFSRCIKAVFADSFLTWQEINILNWQPPSVLVKMTQPHGALGMPHSSNGSATIIGTSAQLFNFGELRIWWHSISPYASAKTLRSFGDVEGFDKDCHASGAKGDVKLNMVSVDDFIPGADMTGYAVTNKLFQNSHVVAIGLSELGFNQSKLDVSTAKSLTVTNRESEFDCFDKERVPSRELCFLVEEGVYATPMMKWLGNNATKS